tara:strand:+ start:1053 stop:1268 length:216 start_codon:yes stop_codon:yes gene_type:complete
MGRLKEFLLGTRMNQIDNDAAIQTLLDEHYSEYLAERAKWSNAEKMAESATIAEWLQLDKPNKKNTYLKNY